PGLWPAPPAAEGKGPDMSDETPAVRLDDLARRINERHEAMLTGLRAALGHARATGELLLEAKGLRGHGTWRPWVRDNCRFSERTASAYMRIASGWGRLQALLDQQPVADLGVGVRAAMRLLARPVEGD